MNQRGTPARPTVCCRPGECIVRCDRVAAVNCFNVEIGKACYQLRDGPSRRLDLHGHGNGVAVVLDQEEHWQPQVTRCIERLPEFSLARGAVARRTVDDLVRLDHLLPIGDLLDHVVA